MEYQRLPLYGGAMYAWLLTLFFTGGAKVVNILGDLMFNSYKNKNDAQFVPPCGGY